MSGNENISQYIAELPPEKRALLEVLLKKENIDISALILPQERTRRSFPLTSAQEQLWFLHQLQPSSTAYNVPMVIRLSGLLHVNILEQTLNEVVRRQEALRTTFAVEDGKPVQVILSAESIAFPVIDLSTLSSTEREQQVQQVMIVEGQQAFNLTAGPLFRVRLLRSAAQEHVLLLTTHHILSDAWSMGILVREIITLYEALLRGETATLPTLSIQMADFAVWQQQWLQGEELHNLLSYWKQQLSGAPPLLNLPTDRPRPAFQSMRGAREYITLSRDLTDALVALSRKQNVSLFMLLLTAFKVLLYRYTGQEDILVGSPVANRIHSELNDVVGFFVNTLIFRTRPRGSLWFLELLQQVREVAVGTYDHQNMPFDKLINELRPERDLSYNPLFQVSFALINTPMPALKLPDLTLSPIEYHNGTAKFDIALDLWETPDGIRGWFEYSTDLFDASTMCRLREHFLTILESIVTSPNQRVADIPLLTLEERDRLLVAWNNTQTAFPHQCIHHLIEAQVTQTPAKPAIIFGTQQYSYQELEQHSNQLAHYLRKLGVGPEVRVGICIERSLEMVIGLLGILKAGGAYVPLDPAYPEERLAFMLEDSQAAVLLTTEQYARKFQASRISVVCLDTIWSMIQDECSENVSSEVNAANLAYVIYTSGSTGRPKGVMLSHQNVVNFFTAMDAHIDCEDPGTWLAVTSISFDISVLELLWTLTRGFQVVIQAELEKVGLSREIRQRAVTKPLDFSLFYFASDDGLVGNNKYQLLIEGAKFADQHGFSAVWTPERHFHSFGGLYPNPSVTSAALATITKHIQLRAGSVVLPLHNTIRVAEEWSVVDNLSNGRVGMSFASGWHANDFVFAPEHYQQRKEVMMREIEVFRKLWAGETISVPGGLDRMVDVSIYPKPIRPDVPIWITAAGNPETFRLAGEIGAHILTHLLGQDLDELAKKIAIYRESWHQHGHGPGDGHVSLMLHAFVGEDLDTVREKVRGPFCNYLMGSVDLIGGMLRSIDVTVKVEELSQKDLESMLSHAFNRYFDRSGLFGTPETCMHLVDRLQEVGVDEVACLIDFGLDFEDVMSGLYYLNEVKKRCNEQAGEDYSFASQMRRYQVTHLQCTPSLAQALLSDAQTSEALRTLQTLLLGGEALPMSLARQLREVVPGKFLNMYGPTETTIWSTTYHITDLEDTVPIGYPLANTATYILDAHHQPVPIGAIGELYIGGIGVARGYLNQPELTAERFIPSPFGPFPDGSESESRLYKTGDLARYRADGTIEFVGRVDQQIKIRGHRIEMGEIEECLRQHPAVREAVVAAHELMSGDSHLIAYIVQDPTYQRSVAAHTEDEWRKEHIAQWEMVWNNAYNYTYIHDDPTFNIVGWQSSYTGDPIPADEMHEWVDCTVERVLSLQPDHVLEIGCGTGLILFPLAPHCRNYLGIDFSEQALTYIRQLLSPARNVSHVVLEQRSADNLVGLEKNAFDVILLNSVVQYFPDVNYLLRVIRGCVEVIAPGGAIFIGDVRSLPLLEIFHTSVQLHRASPSLSKTQVLQRAKQAIAQEEELVIDPAFFTALAQALPRISHVEIQLKRGSAHNEMTMFRYDVILHIEAPVPRADNTVVLDWQHQQLTMTEVKRVLQEEQPELLTVKNVPNARLLEVVNACDLLHDEQSPETINEFRKALRALPEREGIDPEDVWQLGADLPYSVNITWSLAGNTYYDVEFKQHNLTQMLSTNGSNLHRQNGSSSNISWHKYTNNPLAAKFARQLVPVLRTHLLHTLPEYMVPSTFILLDALPLTPNGKVNRRALPTPNQEQDRSEKTFIAPRTDTEKVIADIWIQLLGVEKIGIHDNFFHLGGHSLSATQLLFRLRDTFQIELPLGYVFDAADLAELATSIDRELAARV